MMEDRFKFRVWAKPHEPTQTEGYYVDDADFMALYPNGKVDVDYYIDDGYAGRCEGFEQNEIIIEQCTGLKDKNSNLIYEGDIIQKENQKFVIKYDFYSFKAYDEENRPISIYGLFTFKICFGGWPGKETENTIEIIGNIHENPELLEQSNDD